MISLKNDRRSFDCSEVQCPLSLSEGDRKPVSAKSSQGLHRAETVCHRSALGGGNRQNFRRGDGKRRAKPRGFRNNFDRTEMVRGDRIGWLMCQSISNQVSASDSLLT